MLASGVRGLRAGLAAVALFGTAPALAAEAPYAEFGDFLDAARKEAGTVSLSAVILRDGAIVWEGYYGTSDDEGEVPTDSGTTYSIASVTKPLAATAIVAESLAGDLALDLPMAGDTGWARTCDWLSRSPIPFGGGGTDPQGVTIPKMDCARPTTLVEMLGMRANADSFVYNPIAYARIDRSIAAAGGRDLRAIVRDRVAEPAGMRNVALGWRDPEGGDALRLLAPPFHSVDGEAVKNAMSDDDFRAAAGIIASPRALAEFDRALDEGLLVPPQWFRKTVVEPAPGPDGDYRMGWFVEDWHGTRLVWHSGWDPERYSAIYLKVPEKRLTLIVLANSEMLWWGNSVVRADIARSPLVRRFLEDFVR